MRRSASLLRRSIVTPLGLLLRKLEVSRQFVHSYSEGVASPREGQQRRVFKGEFRNTHFSYILGSEGVEQFVSTPELHSDEAIESDPLPPGQVWGVSARKT